MPATVTRLRFFSFLFVQLTFWLPAAQAIDLPSAPPVAARAWLLMDTQSGQIVQSQAADERVEPASLTKLMTAYVVFAAIKEKRISLTQTVPVSERAWKAGGSRMFIEPRKPVTVEELIHGMIIQSGNDACIALAELVAGSEELFAQLMNKEAQRLGMKNTSFMNSTGLPDPKHFTTARDLATLASALIRDFPEQYGKYYSMKEYRYNNITQQNRNRLLWLDPNVDGMKTGFTDNAGYCLIASAKRGSRRLLSVVLGTASDSMRAQESQKILNFGFQFYDSVRLYEKGQTVSALKVWKGSLSELNAGSLQGDITISVPRGTADKIKAEFVGMEPIVAPVSAGQRVGMVKVTLEGKPIAEYPVVALENIAVAGIFGRTWDTMRLWFK
jgi:D-alanyl-D-alanine carboxypeptidase (penicillin-binding protein 5/6)